MQLFYVVSALTLMMRGHGMVSKVLLTALEASLSFALLAATQSAADIKRAIGEVARELERG